MRKLAGRGTVLAAVLLGALCVPWGPASAAPPATGEPPALLTASPSSRRSDQGGRPVDVHTELLVPGVARTVDLSLPGTDPVEVDLVPTASGTPGWAAWSGSVEGAPRSSVDLVRQGDVVSGVVVTLDGGYRIQPAAGGHVVRALRTDVVEGPDTLVPPAGFDPAPPDVGGDTAPSSRAAGDPVIDVLVAYTPAAETQMGGQAAIQSEIALGIAATNAAFADSAVAGSVRLVGTQRTSGNILANSEGLLKVTVGNDGVLDEVPVRRTALGADLVSVFTGETATGCGIGWLMSSMTQGGGFGYSLVDWGCAVDNLSMPHEIGHNMGLEHDRYVAPNNSLADDGHGYVNVAGGWRTIMAYNNACTAASTFCTRIRRFSNPDQTYMGAPLGRPASGPESADSHRVLNITFPVVAKWRASYAPFSSWSAFVRQQIRDFEGRTPSASEISGPANALAEGTTAPATYISDKAHGTTFGGAYAPVARLYFAFFLRTPDKSGLDYWVGRYRSGTSLPVIANGFAGSQEFKTRYGTLTNRAFVEKVYMNVLGRPGEVSGVNYWTSQLDQRKKTRGAVMVGFSEASEFKRVRLEEIDTVLVYRGMLQRTPTTSEFQAEVARLEGGTPLSQVILDLLASSAYRARITV